MNCLYTFLLLFTYSNILFVLHILSCITCDFLVTVLHLMQCLKVLEKLVIYLCLCLVQMSKSFICRSCTDLPASIARTIVDFGDGASVELVDKFLLE